jgi:Predicted membrane-associated Zn-dependent proteases 1
VGARFEPGWKEVQYGPLGALGHSVQLTWSAAKATVTFLPRLITGSGRKEVSSPVGIIDTSSQAASLTFTLFLLILGLISLSLAILNLLPLLPLDGGTSSSRSSRVYAAGRWDARSTNESRRSASPSSWC